MDIANSKVKIPTKINLIEFLKRKYWLILLITIFVFSFALDLFILTRYSLSYGIDGAFYDIQVLNILQQGVPLSNDPPLAYYLLTPFVLLSGNSFLGIKIGMAFIGSLLVFPAYFITESYVRKKNGKILGSKVPALLSAFLITVNVNYFSLITNFMQNLVGVLFLSLFLYFAIKWFENIQDWKKYGIITVLLLGANLFTHIYTGALAVALFFALLIFSILLKTYKTRELPLFDLKILGLFTVLVGACFVALFFVYPVMYTKYGTVLSFLNFSSTTTSAGGVSNPVNGLIFCSLPYLMVVVASLIIFYRGLKGKIPSTSTSALKINPNTLLAGSYLSLAAALVILVVIPASDYQSRFLLIAFLPIGLLVPLGLKFIETEFLARYPEKKLPTLLLVVGIALIFAFSSFFTASQSFNSLGPTITNEQYNELVELKASYFNTTNGSTIILASDMQTKYWIEYVLGDDANITVVENINGVQGNYKNSTVYSVNSANNQTSAGHGTKVFSTNSTLNPGNSTVDHSNSANNPPTTRSNSFNNVGNGMDSHYELSLLLPYGPSLLPNSWDQISVNTGGSSNSNPLNRNDHHLGNNSTGVPGGNLTSFAGGPGNMPPDNNTFSNNMQQQGGTGDGFNQTQGVMGNKIGSGVGNQSLEIAESGTTVYSGIYFQLIRLDVI